MPAGLDWDFWQGQAPAADYVTERCHRTFRFWYEYSGGTMTDWGAHHNDIAYWAIGLLAPREVTAKRFSEPVPGGYNAYADYEVNYTYANGIGLQINTTKDDSIFGEKLNPAGPAQRHPLRRDRRLDLGQPRRDQRQRSASCCGLPCPTNAVRLYESKDHMGNFFDCVRSRELPICDVETGHRSATMCHLGAIALRTGQSLTWDSAEEKFVGEHAAEANGYLVREMRKPYDYSF